MKKSNVMALMCAVVAIGVGYVAFRYSRSVGSAPNYNREFVKIDENDYEPFEIKEWSFSKDVESAPQSGDFVSVGNFKYYAFKLAISEIQFKELAQKEYKDHKGVSAVFLYFSKSGWPQAESDSNEKDCPDCETRKIDDFTLSPFVPDEIRKSRVWVIRGEMPAPGEYSYWLRLPYDDGEFLGKGTFSVPESPTEN